MTLEEKKQSIIGDLCVQLGKANSGKGNSRKDLEEEGFNFVIEEDYETGEVKVTAHKALDSVKVRLKRDIKKEEE